MSSKIEQFFDDLARDPWYGINSVELGDMRRFLTMVPKEAIEELEGDPDFLNLRRLSGREGDGTLVVEWNGTHKPPAYRLLRFVTHGYGGLWVTAQQFNAGAEKPPQFDWSFGNENELVMGRQEEAKKLISSLFDWYYS